MLLPTELITNNTGAALIKNGASVSIPRGALGRIAYNSNEVMVQVLIWWKDERPEIVEVVGVPRNYIQVNSA